MTTDEKILNVQALVEHDEEATDAVVSVYLSQAESVILGLLYRTFEDIPDGATVPKKYEYDQCELASRYFLRKGSQGETVHNENGVNRTYGSVDDQDILRRIMPYARVY